MKFKVGDRVKFLDEHGGGIISKIVSHNLVHVAIEDGFEIPTLVNNLIKEEDMHVGGNRQTTKDPSSQVDTVIEEDEPGRDALLPNLRGKKEMPEGIYLAFFPEDQKWLTTGKYEIFLINHSSWEVLFSLYLDHPQKGYVGKDYDIIPEASSFHLATVKPERLEYWSKGTIQLLFRKDQTDHVLLPSSVDFKIKGYRFLKEGAYQEYSFMEGRVFLVNLVGISAIGKAGKPDRGETEDPTSSKAYQDEDNEIIHQYRKGDKSAEVDLHIQALMEDYEGLGKHDLFNIQLGHFLACLESGIRSGYRNITFIHGVGDGKLKRELEERLAAYKGVSFEDAPLKDYGQGAILVKISGKAEV